MAQLIDTIPTPQSITETFCQTGYRDTPHSAHFAAAALTVEFFRKEQVLDPELEMLVVTTEAQLIAWPELQSPQPTTRGCEHDGHRNDLVKLMESSFSGLRRSGHAQILTTALLKTVDQHGVQLSCEMLDGAEGLIEACGNEREEPRFINRRADYWADETASPSSDRIDDVAIEVFDLFDSIQADTTIDGVKYFLNGEKLHAFTYLHALMECRALGMDNLVAKGLGSLSIQTRLSKPVIEDVPLLEIDLEASNLDLMRTETWQEIVDYSGDLGIPHAIKRLYAIHRIKGSDYKSHLDTALPTLMTAIKNG